LRDFFLKKTALFDALDGLQKLKFSSFELSEFRGQPSPPFGAKKAHGTTGVRLKTDRFCSTIGRKHCENNRNLLKKRLFSATPAAKASTKC
jgi:hypothetical protein